MGREEAGVGMRLRVSRVIYTNISAEFKTDDAIELNRAGAIPMTRPDDKADDNPR